MIDHFLLNVKEQRKKKLLWRPWPKLFISLVPGGPQEDLLLCYAAAPPISFTFSFSPFPLPFRSRFSVTGKGGLKL